MKRLFVIFGVALLCLSLCVNVAFASDVINARVDQNIFVYFPWFGGVSGSSANRVTNYATVTTSDVSSSSVTVNQVLQLRDSVTYSVGVSLVTSNTTHYSLSGVSSGTGIYRFTPDSSFQFTSGHVYYIYNSGNVGIGIGPTVYNGSFVFEPVNDYYSVGFSFVSGVDYTGISGDINIFDLTSIFNSNIPTDPYNSLIELGVSFPCSYGPHVVNNISSFSLVPASAANGGSSSHEINDYTWYHYSADLSLTGDSKVALADFMVDQSYSIYSSTTSGGYNLWYITDSFYDFLTNNNYGTLTPYIWGSVLSANIINVYLETNFSGILGLNAEDINSTSLYNYYRANINDFVQDYKVWGVGYVGGYNDFTSDLSTEIFNSNLDATGTFTIDRIFRTNDNSYFLFNNQVNLGTYDFNVNVKFPSLDKFNNFSGYWMASFNTSWGEIPVRTQIQEVSANSDTLIKIYKLTFDVPFTGQYTKFNINYVGDSSAFTTIRVESSVVDPNAYQNGAGPTTINGFSFYLSSMFDKFWGKIRSLFFDQDQTMAESVPVEAGQLAEEVSSGAQTIHEFETNNFDSIEQQQEDLDWDLPMDFGQASNPTSALGFIATVFSGVFFALGSKVTPIIVIPLMLGLCLLILGRGTLALGRLANNRRK